MQGGFLQVLLIESASAQSLFPLRAEALPIKANDLKVAIGLSKTTTVFFSDHY